VLPFTSSLCIVVPGQLLHLCLAISSPAPWLPSRWLSTAASTALLSYRCWLHIISPRPPSSAPHLGIFPPRAPGGTPTVRTWGTHAATPRMRTSTPPLHAPSWTPTSTHLRSRPFANFSVFAGGRGMRHRPPNLRAPYFLAKE
jgi:hypothetical protein